MLAQQIDNHTTNTIALVSPGHAGSTQQLPQTFTHALTIYLKDSNAYGNTYFARYFEWQGVCRERWFHECVAHDMLQGLGVFITKHAEQEYLNETFPFQQVHCELNTYAIRRCSFWLEFRFFADDKLAAIGRQHIVFANHARQITALPPTALEKIRSFAIRPNSAH